ncbi:hypothetical protein JX266_008503 [Neoarthrinium moseri]|nr:hypothetical protein JX266_008503 [Neoarthrinium moseri]
MTDVDENLTTSDHPHHSLHHRPSDSISASSTGSSIAEPISASISTIPSSPSPSAESSKPTGQPIMIMPDTRMTLPQHVASGQLYSSREDQPQVHQYHQRRDISPPETLILQPMNTGSYQQQQKHQQQYHNDHPNEHDPFQPSTASFYNDHHDSGNSNRPPSRKRAASINTDDANNQPRIQDLSLHTPGSVQTSSSFAGGPTEQQRELICLCTKAPKVPRPRNAFILYRQHHQAQVAAEHPGLANPDISKLIGEQWREQPEDVKSSWKRLAEEEKARHQRQYPDYRYQPRRGGKAGSGKPATSGGNPGEDPGRCQKCGGRYIATPRTPSTPFGAAAPPGFAKSPPMSAMSGMAPGYMVPNPNPRVIETDHLRRGSGASMMSVDSHGRRYTQPYLRDIEEDYAMMSPTASPAHKRPRYNGHNGNFMPASPPMGYMPHPADPRFQQRPSVSGPAGTAAGFGPGLLPRPGMVHQQNGMPRQSIAIPGMQPPPRPSVSFQGAAQTPTRGGPGFDESLRLPPLQTQVPTSPTMASEASGVTASTTKPGTGTMSPAPNGNAAQKQNQQQQHHHHYANQMPSQRLQFLLKLDMLRAISPPLKPPGQGAPPHEIRGPIIAVEGDSPAELKEVTAVVEKALSVSGECAVRIWADSESEKELLIGNKPNDDAAEKAQEEGGEKQNTAALHPIAKYMARMLEWHRTSADLIRYITNQPDPTRNAAGSLTDSPNAMEVDRPAPTATLPPSNTTGAHPSSLPVAVMSTGYSLTVSDRWAAALPLIDTYRAEDHWRWVATLWRGIVGADLTIYVKRCGAEELQAVSCVEFASPGVLILRVPESAAEEAAAADGPSEARTDGQASAVDEKLERRLGFEIMEWVRNGPFGRRSV